MQHFYVAALRFCENHGLFICYNIVTRRGRLVVYGAALERRFAGNCIEGSNPSPSAILHIIVKNTLENIMPVVAPLLCMAVH